MARYNFVNGRVKVQVESMLGTNPGGGWVYQAPGQGNNPGAEGAHYYYKSQTQQGSHKTAPTQGRFSFEVNVQDAGQYSILLRASRDTKNPGDARNDIWIKVDGGTQSVMPNGTPPLTGGGNGFVKFKSAPQPNKWLWANTFSTPNEHDNNARSTVVFDQGVHTITFAPRSTGYHIDSVQVIKKGLPVTAAALEATAFATALDSKEVAALDAKEVAALEAKEPTLVDGAEVEAKDPEVAGVANREIVIDVDRASDDFESNKAAASGDLEFGRDGAGAQSVGLRFEAAAIDKDAEIKSAYFVFEAAETSKGAAHFTIEVEDSTWDPLESTCRHASLSIL